MRRKKVKNQHAFIAILLVAVTLLLVSGCPSPLDNKDDQDDGNTDTTPQVTYYSVAYDGNSADSGEVPVTLRYKEGETVAVQDNSGSLEKTGYTFFGWNTAADGTGTPMSAGDTFDIGNEDVTLYAQWLPLEQIVVPGDATAGDYFGYSVDISGDYAIVGAHHDSYDDPNPGYVYIYRRTGAHSWDEGYKLSIDGLDNEEFGFSVAISGDYAIVGAPQDNTGVNMGGGAYIFHRTGLNTWDDGVRIQASSMTSYDAFGDSVDISGDYAIVGAYGTDTTFEGSSIRNSGAAHIFKRTDVNDWSHVEMLEAPTPQASSFFGDAVAIDGDYAVVGAKAEDEDTTTADDSGAAYIFHRSTDTNMWDSVARVVSSDTTAADRYSDNFGNAVSISGDRVAVGALYDDEEYIYAGSVFIFERTDTNTWSEGEKITLGSGAVRDDEFGTSLALEGNTLVVGARGPENHTGAVFVLENEGSVWSLIQRIEASDGQQNDNFGLSVSVSGDLVLTGSFGRDDEDDNGEAITNIGAMYSYIVE